MKKKVVLSLVFVLSLFFTVFNSSESVAQLYSGVRCHTLILDCLNGHPDGYELYCVDVDGGSTYCSPCGLIRKYCDGSIEE